LLCEKTLEDKVPTGQEIKVHTKFKQLMLPWQVVIGCEQRDTKHIITLSGQSGKCFLILRQVVHALTVVLEDIFRTFLDELTDIRAEVSNVI
jgi:hypothetical protein